MLHLSNVDRNDSIVGYESLAQKYPAKLAVRGTPEGLGAIHLIFFGPLLKM